MAKSSDSFFIRAKVEQTAAGYVTEKIDLGSFVNLGPKSSTLLRIHNISVQIADESEPFKGPFTNGATLNIGWDLTTQEQTALLPLSNKSVVASGRYMVSDQTVIDFDSSHKDLMPQTWTNGYLVGVDALYLNSQADSTSTNTDYFVSIVLECTTETATQASATALALSQQ
jgi:hypothetical protein